MLGIGYMNEHQGIFRFVLQCVWFELAFEHVSDCVDEICSMTPSHMTNARFEILFLSTRSQVKALGIFVPS